MTKSTENKALMIWDEKQDAIKEAYGKDLTKNEFTMFMEMGKALQLNPFNRQIWAVKYGYGPAQIFVSRDGFLSIAHKSGQFNGMETTFVEPKDATKIEDLTATCTVYRKDMEHAIVVTVRMGEYNTKMSVWKSKPRTMLQKVAESQALRRAFNVAGVYSPEEFDQVKQANKKQTNTLVKPIVVENKDVVTE